MTTSPFETDEHTLWRDTVRRFVDHDFRPFVNEWDEQGVFPRELYEECGRLGLFGIGFDESVGGNGEDDPRALAILAEELARCGAGGVAASLLSNYIGAPPISRGGSDRLRQEILPRVMSGEAVCALAITEPGGGSDVAALATRARRDGDEWIINGEKTFITSGMRADYVTTAVRTGGPGYGGISLIVVPTTTPGFSATELPKMGWWASGTATLYLDDCRVPADHLLGTQDDGFRLIMKNFNAERLFMIAGMVGASRLCFDEALAWARSRHTFEAPLVTRQVIRHKLVDMDRHINATAAWLEQLIRSVEQGNEPVAQLAECKVNASLMLEYCAREAAQILGGASFIRGNPVERIYREVRVNAIGGGSEEIMKDLAARQLGL